MYLDMIRRKVFGFNYQIFLVDLVVILMAFLMGHMHIWDLEVIIVGILMIGGGMI